MSRIARQGTLNRRGRSTRHKTLLVVVAALGLTIGSTTLAGTVAASQPEVGHERFEFTHEETNFNICGDLGVFRFSGTDTFTVVGFSDGVFHFNLIERGTYTLTFLAEPQETWDSRFTESISFNATPGSTVAFASAYNSFERPIRIHEMATFVVGPDGSIRVDDYTLVADECPPA